MSEWAPVNSVEEACNLSGPPLPPLAWKKPTGTWGVGVDVSGPLFSAATTGTQGVGCAPALRLIQGGVWTSGADALG